MKIDDFEKIKLEALPRVIDVHSMLLTDIDYQSVPAQTEDIDGVLTTTKSHRITNFTLVNPMDGMRIVITKSEVV